MKTNGFGGFLAGAPGALEIIRRREIAPLFFFLGRMQVQGVCETPTKNDSGRQHVQEISPHTPLGGYEG